MKIGTLRFVLFASVGALSAALAGIALIYLSFDAWQVSEFHTKGRVLSPSSTPIEFYGITIFGALFGASLLPAALWLVSKVFAPPMEQTRIAKLFPKIFGPIRPSLLIAVVLLFSLTLLAWITR